MGLAAFFFVAGATTAPPFDFVLRHDPTPEKRQIETMPGGVAILDYDNDGRPDLFFVNGAARNRLYRNLGNWRFEDVTARAGLAGEGFGMAAAAADHDNDGFADLLVLSVGKSRLYRNRGDGTFTEVTSAAGIPASDWPIGAGWFDADHDGDLDLFVVNYVKWPAAEPFCGDREAGYRTYCHPRYYEGVPNLLLLNDGHGHFTESAGLPKLAGKGMAVAFADYDADGRPDIFVTNDTEPNLLLHNEGGGRFRERGVDAGIAMTDEGKVLSSMGAVFQDIDGDLRPDLFFTALTNETFPLYRNLGNGLFADMTYRSRLGTASLASSGWSAGAYDFDNDGHRDLFTANGDVQDNTERFSNRASRQRNQLFRNLGNGSFAATALGEPAQHRGAAFADLDGDGRIDAVVSRLGQAPVLWRNTLPGAGHWIAFHLRGRAANRDGLGARVRVTAGGRTQQWEVTTAVGYASSSWKLAHFGLGAVSRVERVEIVWPGGRRQELTDVAADRVVTVEEAAPIGACAACPRPDAAIARAVRRLR